ncbi:MAG: DUF2314 domain-containing protein [Anderseniella sp.]
MRQLFCVLICLACGIAYLIGGHGTIAIAQSSNVTGVSKDDKEMNSAMASARKTMAQFWTALENPPAGATGFAIKVAFSDNGEVEHIWCNSPERRNGKILATINNTPVTVTHVKDGQRLEIDPQDISDWMYVRADQKIVGGRTIRALLKHLPKDQADYYRSILVTE